MAEQHPSSVAEAVAERRDNAIDHVRVEIDQHIAAEDQIEIRELKRRCAVEQAQQIVPFEAHHRAEFRAQLPLLTLRGLHEVRRLLLRRQRTQSPLAKAGVPGGIEKVFVDVGADNADAPVFQRIPEKLGDKDRNRIGLCAGRTSGTPDPQALVVGSSRGDFGEDHVS